MKLRDIDGTLQFDNDSSTLDIHVVPRDKDCATAVSKTTNLSGGERSYTTVAFLLSLWSCVDHPFYFLDEYDVFAVSALQCIFTNSWILILTVIQLSRIQLTVCLWQNCYWTKRRRNRCSIHSSRLRILHKSRNPRISIFCGTFHQIHYRHTRFAYIRLFLQTRKSTPLTWCVVLI